VKALLLAAGFGTRLRPLTDTVPKCLVPVRGKPLLGYWLDLLLEAGVGPLLVNTHYLPEQVEAFVARSPHRARVETVFEPRLLGTGGTVLRNRAWLGDAPFMLIHADNLSRFPVAGFLAAHAQRPAGCEMTMMTFETDDPRSCGVLELDGLGRVVRFHEKVADPPTNLANGAAYILEPSLFPFIQSLGKEEVDFSTEVIPAYLGRIMTFKNEVYHRDIGNLESYAQAQLDSRYLPGNP
jgi:mannose-1-phosphate guanylyltransferase